MAKDLGTELNRIMEREMKEMGPFMVTKQCKNLSIDPTHISPKDLPKLSKALSEVMKSFGGTEKAKALNSEILKLANVETLIVTEKHQDSKIDMLLDMGDTYITTCEWSKAREQYFQIMGIADQLKDDGLRSQILSKIAFAYSKQGEYEKAMSNYKSALELAKKAGDKRALGQSLAGIGHIHWRWGEYDPAIERFEDALENAKKLEDLAIIGTINIEMGNVCSDTGKLDRAEALFKQAVENLEKAEHHQQLARARNNLGDLYIQKHNWEEAIKQFELSRHESDETGNIQMKAWAAFNSADAHLHLGKLEQAKAFLDEALPVLERLGDKSGLSATHRILGIYHGMKKEYVVSQQQFDKAIELAREIKTPFKEGMAQLEMSRMFMRKGDGVMSRTHLEEAKRIFRRLKVERYKHEIEDITKKLSSGKGEVGDLDHHA